MTFETMKIAPISPETEQNNASWPPKIKISEKLTEANQTGTAKNQTDDFFFQNPTPRVHF